MSLVLSAILAAHPVPPPHPAELAEMLIGRWDTAAQAAQDDTDRPHLFLRHVSVDSAAFPGVPLYAELRLGGPEGEIYRQRVYVIAPASGGYDMEMRVYELADPDAYAGAGPEAFTGLEPDDVVRFDPGCDPLWRLTAGGWDGAIEDGTCVRPSQRSGRELIITARFSIRPDVYTHSESGRYADTGEPVFGPPAGVPNRYDRVTE